MAGLLSFRRSLRAKRVGELQLEASKSSAKTSTTGPETLVWSSTLMGELLTQTRLPVHTSLRGVTTCPLRCHTSLNSVNTSGCMRVTCPDTRHRTVVLGCLRIWLLNFLIECR